MPSSLVIERVALITAAMISFSLVLRLIYYHAKLRAISRYCQAYEHFCEATPSDPSNHSPYADILEKQPEIVKLFKESQLSPPVTAYAEPAGYGFIQPTQVSAWENLQADSGDIRTQNWHSFHKSIGYFRARRNETVSPVFWIESLVNWPRSLLGFLGFNSEGAFAKFLQVLVLILEIAGGIVLAVNNLQ